MASVSNSLLARGQAFRVLLAMALALVSKISVCAPQSIEFTSDMYEAVSSTAVEYRGLLKATLFFDLSADPTYRYDLDGGRGLRGGSSIDLIELQAEFNGLSYWMEYGSVIFSSDSPGDPRATPSQYVDQVVFHAEMHPLNHGRFPGSHHLSFAFSGSASMLETVDPPGDLLFLTDATRSVARMNLISWPARTYGSGEDGVALTMARVVSEPSALLLSMSALIICALRLRVSH